MEITDGQAQAIVDCGVCDWGNVRRSQLPIIKHVYTNSSSSERLCSCSSWKTTPCKSQCVGLLLASDAQRNMDSALETQDCGPVFVPSSPFAVRLQKLEHALFFSKALSSQPKNHRSMHMVASVRVNHPTDSLSLKPGSGIIPRGLDTCPAVSWQPGSEFGFQHSSSPRQYHQRRVGFSCFD